MYNSEQKSDDEDDRNYDEFEEFLSFVIKKEQDALETLKN